MSEHKVSDMNKEYIINFLQEYSYYIKIYRKDEQFMKSTAKLKCPTEFFNNNYLDILKETEQYNNAFKEEMWWI